MEKLKDQIRSAREEYQGLRYPGDLSVEILSRLAPHNASRHNSRWAWSVGALAAAAAMIVLALQLHVPTNSKTPDAGVEIAMADAVVEPALVAISDLPSMSMPAPPSDWDTRGSDVMDFAPSSPEFGIPVPSLSGNDDAQPASYGTQEVTL